VLLALVLCGFLVVGVPILVLATAPGAHADPWGGLGEGPSGGQAGSAGAGDDLGDPAGVQPTGTPEPVPWDAEATTTLQLRSGLEAPAPAPPATPDRQDSRGTPLPAPSLGHLLTRDPDSDGQVLAQAPDPNGDGRGNDDHPPTGQARPGDWKLHIAGLEALTDHPDPLPASRQPGGADQAAATDHRLAVTTNLQPDQDRERASLVIADGDPGESAWVQLAAGSAVPAVNSLRMHLGSQLPDRTSAPAAASTGAIGQPSATALVVQLPAQPRTTLGTPPAVDPGAQAAPSQPAHVIPSRRVVAAHDGVLPGLPPATIVLTAAPIRAGSLATGTQAMTGAGAGGQRGQLDQPGSARLVGDMGDGRMLGRLPASGSVLLLSNGSQVPLAAEGTPLVTPIPAGAAALVADAQTSRALRAGIAGWDSENWEYLAAAGLFIGAVVAMSSSVFAVFPFGATVLIGALLGAGTSVAIQKLTTGQVNWNQTAVHSVIGGTIFALAAGLELLTATATATAPFWNWLLYWRDDGGVTRFERLSGWWPRYRAAMRNFAVPGTVAWRDTQAHEGFHFWLSEHAGPWRWLTALWLCPVPVGAPLVYAEEIVGRMIGHLSVGRLHAVLLAPYDSFVDSLYFDQQVTTVVMSLAGLSAYQAWSKRPARVSDTPGDARGLRTQDRREGTSP